VPGVFGNVTLGLPGGEIPLELPGVPVAPLLCAFVPMPVPVPLAAPPVPAPPVAVPPMVVPPVAAPPVAEPPVVAPPVVFEFSVECG